MADGFVQQDAWPTGPEDDGGFACGGFDGIEQEKGEADGFAGIGGGKTFSGEAVQRPAAAATRRGAFDAAICAPDQDGDVEAGERLRIFDKAAVAGGDQDLLDAGGEGGHHLEDAVVGGTGSLVGLKEQAGMGVQVGGQLKVPGADRVRQGESGLQGGLCRPVLRRKRCWPRYGRRGKGAPR